MDQHITNLQSLLSDPSSSLLTPSSDPSRFAASTRPWSCVHDRRPSAVVEPRSEGELEKVVKYLVEAEDVDFAVRGTGVGNSSAADVVVNLAAFDRIAWADADRKILEVGAGLTLGDVDRWLEENAPDYAVVGSRCPFVGVTGSTLMGGLSWLSSTLGLGSDPSNLLDARITLASGSSLWASSSSDPSLLWSLRGGGGNFGAVSLLRLQAHRVSRKIWSGMIRYRDPLAAVSELSRRTSIFASRDRTDGLACHVFVVDFGLKALHGGAARPDLVLLPFDPLGEAHARSADGFAWALDDIPGGVDDSACAEGPLALVHAAQAGQAQTHGRLASWMAAALVDSPPAEGAEKGGVEGRKGGEEEEEAEEEEAASAVAIDEHTVRRAYDWYASLVSDGASRRFSLGAFALLEVMQGPTMTAAGSAAATAWPHHALGRKNVLQLGVGCAPADDERQRHRDHEAAMRILAQAPDRIMGGSSSSSSDGAAADDATRAAPRQRQPPGHHLPNFIQPDIHDVPAIFGQNWTKLRQVKTRYDPKGRFNKGFFIPPL